MEFRSVTLIRRLHLAVRAELVEVLRARGYDDITPAHIYVFQTPGPDGVRPTELAQRALMTKQAMNHLLAGLEQRGYLERVGVDGDRRARRLRLTDKGRRLTALIQQTSSQIEQRWAETLGSGAMHALVDALGVLDELESGVRSSGRPDSQIRDGGRPQAGSRRRGSPTLA